MNSNIDEKEAELRHNYRFARALLNKLYFNINDLYILHLFLIISFIKIRGEKLKEEILQ